MARFAIPLGGLGARDVALVGGKSANLGELTRAGFPVPPGFAVTTEAYERAAPRPGEPPVLPADVTEAVAVAYDRLGRELGRDDPPVAVRSSAVAEDTEEASFAGVQSTYVWLRGVDRVLDGIRRCWASYYNPEAVAYRQAHAVAESGMSVAVHSMVDARVAGVMFTLNPVSGDRSTIAIDASYGLGVTVVGGEVTPDTFLVSKVTREVVRTEIGRKETEVVVAPDGTGTLERAVEPERRAQPCLTAAELARLAAIGREVERHYGRPQDVEWALDRDGTLYLLQARPETVWSGTRRRPPSGGTAGLANPFAAIVKNVGTGR